MTDTNQPVVKPRTILRTLRKNALLWIVPTIAFTLAAFAFGLYANPSWEASQALLLRDEAGDVKNHGRFENMDAMKTAQKTILELARNNDALATALKSIGPPTGSVDPQSWPTVKDVQQCRKYIALKPPKGAEFGSTEVIYLSVRAMTAPRAIELANAVYAQLEQRMQQLRNDKAETSIAELAETVKLAVDQLEIATARLEEMEAEVGSDLEDLRGLNSASGATSSLQTSLMAVQDELRGVRTRKESDTQLQSKLVAASKDSEQLVAMPNSLLTSQPALRRLKDGLVDAQLRTAQLLGSMRERHPAVQAALESEKEVRQHLHDELEVAIRGLATDLEVSSDRIAALNEQMLTIGTKLNRLARLRARYDNVESEVTRRREILEESQKDFADARATLAAAKTSSLITQLEKPQVGDQPLGPGLVLLTLGGLIGGLATGLGLVFLIAPFEQSGNRRWSDRLFGRRQSDEATESGRRESRQPDGAQPQAPGHSRRAADSGQRRPAVGSGDHAAQQSRRRRTAPPQPTPTAPPQSRPTSQSQPRPDKRAVKNAIKKVVKRTGGPQPARPAAATKPPAQTHPQPAKQPPRTQRPVSRPPAEKHSEAVARPKPVDPPKRAVTPTKPIPSTERRNSRPAPLPDLPADGSPGLGQQSPS